jgi:hypothetical protein
MNVTQVYDTTRGVWVVGTEARDRVEYALAVYRGQVLDVYKITAWHPAGTTEYASGRTIELPRYKRRWEFTGYTARADVRERLMGLNVQQHFPNVNPVRYLDL